MQKEGNMMEKAAGFEHTNLILQIYLYLCMLLGFSDVFYMYYYHLRVALIYAILSQT